MVLFFVLLSVTVVIILGLCNIQENLTLLPTEYRWGLKGKKGRKHHKNNKKHHRKKHHKFHKYFPNYEEPKGKYKCYYEPDELDECSEFNEKCPIQNHRDLNNYILKSEIPPQPNLSQYILKSKIPPAPSINFQDIPDLSNYVSKDSIPDMSNYISKDELSKYVHKDNLPNMPDFIHKNDINNEPDLSKYIKKSNVPNMDKYMLTTECKKCKEEDINFGQLIPDKMQQKSKCLMKNIDSRRNVNKKC